MFSESAQRERLWLENKRAYRFYRELEFNMRIKSKKRIIRDKPGLLAEHVAIKHAWSMGFMQDQLRNGHSYRLFNVIDEFNRKGLGIAVDFLCLWSG